MAVVDPVTLLAKAAAGQQPGMRLIAGRWDGTHFRPSESPDMQLAASNAAGPLAVDSFVYAILDGHEVVIIGPIKEAAVPTAGSNANGQWWRSPDGLQICWVNTNTVKAATAEYGSLHQSRWQWNFPISFWSQPSVSCGLWQWGTSASWPSQSGLATTHMALLRGIDAFPHYSTEPLVISATAVGRWRS